MKIDVKFNIHFKKILNFLQDKGTNRFTSITKNLNDGVSQEFAEISKEFINSGHVTPKLSKNNPRGVNAKPLFDTGKLKESLKGSSKGLMGVSYAKEHRKKGGYDWTNPRGKKVKVPQREFIPIDESGYKSEIKEIYKSYEKEFVNLFKSLLRQK
tara:strand:- start:280 stop:744 length:465 start_codon:yes stop_codon:yes gene_type:complete